MYNNSMKKKIRIDCKCDCGHRKDEHVISEGACIECACTWFHPNIKRIKANKRSKR